MPLGSRLRAGLNSALRGFNLRLETLTAERAETARLARLDAHGQFSTPVSPVLPQFRESKAEQILLAVDRFREITDRFSLVRGDRYSFDNDYFSSPDAEVAYAIVRELRPGRIVEVGSGNSTRLFREAIEDGGLATELVSIDPRPRTSISAVADRILSCRLEEVPESEFEKLGPDDILFIDSSHEVRTGNDVVRLFLKVLPQLRKGVVVHVHDIFLPYDYPRKWVMEHRWSFNEQYLVQALLEGSRTFDVIWAGHFLQRTLTAFPRHFREPLHTFASSLWLRKCQ